MTFNKLISCKFILNLIDWKWCRSIISHYSKHYLLDNVSLRFHLKITVVRCGFSTLKIFRVDVPIIPLRYTYVLHNSKSKIKATISPSNGIWNCWNSGTKCNRATKFYQAFKINSFNKIRNNITQLKISLNTSWNRWQVCSDYLRVKNFLPVYGDSQI